MNLTQEKHATFTPGPWHAHSTKVSTWETQEQIKFHGDEVIAETGFEANARLIAAAPALLEQCKLFEKVLKAIGDMGYKDEIDLDSLSWLMRTMELREILAKVDGGEG